MEFYEKITIHMHMVAKHPEVWWNWSINTPSISMPVSTYRDPIVVWVENLYEGLGEILEIAFLLICTKQLDDDLKDC